MRVQEMIQSAYYTFNTDNSNQRFNHDFLLSLNESLNEFSNYRKWGCLRALGSLTTTASTRTVALWDDYGTLFDVRGSIRCLAAAATSTSAIQFVAIDQMYSSYYSYSTEGTPTKCWVIGDDMYLSPIPDAAYTITALYYKRPAEITGLSGEIADPPSRYHEIIKRLVFKRLQENGYTSDREIMINESEIQKLYGQMAKDDNAAYGGTQIALYDDGYTTTIG